MLPFVYDSGISHVGGQFWWVNYIFCEAWFCCHLDVGRPERYAGVGSLGEAGDLTGHNFRLQPL
jgi:hypothetical protein